MVWKKNLYTAVVVVVIFFLIEIMLQKEPYSVLDIFISTAASGAIAFLFLTVLGRFIGKPKNKQNENL